MIDFRDVVASISRLCREIVKVQKIITIYAKSDQDLNIDIILLRSFE